MGEMGAGEELMTLRTALKRGTAVAAAGAIAAATGDRVAKEVSRFMEGVKTKAGVFKGLYEDHLIGIKAESIPKDTDVFFREFALSSEPGQHTMMDMDAKILIRYKGVARRMEDKDHPATIPIFSAEVLDRLEDCNAELMVGDVFLGRFNQEGVGIFKNQLAYLLPAVPGLAALAKSILDKDLKVSRRGFLAGAGAVLARWGAFPLSRGAVGMADGIEMPEQMGINRVAARLSALETEAHPELLIWVFRDALMANKMLTVAENTKSKKGNLLPKFAFQAEHGHIGIEDMLAAGQDICRAIILSYPNEVLREMTDNNGGIEQFCMSRLMDIKKNGRGGEVIKERFVVDTTLKQELEKRLG